MSILACLGLEGQPTLDLGCSALRGVVPDDQIPDFSLMDDPASPGFRTGLLAAAGLRELRGVELSWVYDHPGFDTWWTLVTDPIFPLGPI